MLNNRIRAHHGLCMQFFEGKGYSSEFTKNMQYVVDCMKNNVDITIIDGKDALCSSCPNLQNGVCSSQDKVCDMDRKVFLLCNLERDTVIKSKDFLEIVYQNIIKKDKLGYICSKCEWFNICSKKIR